MCLEKANGPNERAISQAEPVLLREVLERYLAPAGKAFINHATYYLYSAFANGKGDDGTDDYTANAPQRNAFQEHAIAKKCHHCHLFP